MSFLDLRVTLNLSSPNDEEKQEQEFRRRYYEDKTLRAKFWQGYGAHIPVKFSCEICSDTGIRKDGSQCQCWREAFYWYLRGFRENETFLKLREIVQRLQAEGII